MRGKLLNLPAVARALGFALVAVAIVAAVLHVRQHEPRVEALHVNPTAAADPLTDELKRCQLIANAAKDDADCEAAWAESRRRFFTYPPAASAPTTPSTPPKSSDR
jgi:conjugative transfer region protein TrbK